MAVVEVGGNDYPFVEEMSITVGDLTGLSTKTITTTVSPFMGRSHFPIVTSRGLPDLGVGIMHSWFSNPTPQGTTLNIKLSNMALLTSVATDPVLFKVVVL